MGDETPADETQAAEVPAADADGVPADATELTTVADLPENGSFLFTVREPSGREEEVLLARTDAGMLDSDDDSEGSNDDDSEGSDGPQVTAWKNFCMHEPDQRLDRGGDVGAAMRDGQVICPRHGSMFDLTSGYCDNGDAAGQTLVEVDVTVSDGVVYLTDDALTFDHEGGIDDDDDMPSSTSHLTF
jgi:nitrite reductase/ring-hydroxylating ferredoxin subunit